MFQLRIGITGLCLLATAAPGTSVHVLMPDTSESEEGGGMVNDASHADHEAGADGPMDATAHIRHHSRLVCDAAQLIRGDLRPQNGTTDNLVAVPLEGLWFDIAESLAHSGATVPPVTGWPPPNGRQSALPPGFLDLTAVTECTIDPVLVSDDPGPLLAARATLSAGGPAGLMSEPKFATRSPADPSITLRDAAFSLEWIVSVDNAESITLLLHQFGGETRTLGPLYPREDSVDKAQVVTLWLYNVPASELPMSRVRQLPYKFGESLRHVGVLLPLLDNPDAQVTSAAEVDMMIRFVGQAPTGGWIGEPDPVFRALEFQEFMTLIANNRMGGSAGCSPLQGTLRQQIGPAHRARRGRAR